VQRAKMSNLMQMTKVLVVILQCGKILSII